MHTPTTNLIDKLLTEQQTLTAVETFSKKHDQAAIPAQAKYYRDLIPLSKPNKDEQFAFEVDLDICTGCKACVVACHSLNGLDKDESWRDVGVITGGHSENAFQQTVTTACHHCADPACMNGCPTLAYEKDEQTGIVRHLDDQCIGCQYCILKCPYDVPKYNANLGIVRKCDMCHSRLKEGEAPACVQSCPNGAISIKIVNKNIHEQAPHMIAGAYNSQYTKPTTTFRSKNTLPENMAAIDQQSLTPEHSHLPLVWMLTFTQVAAGVFTAMCILDMISEPGNNAAQLPLAIVALGFACTGLGVGFLHLGSPLGAWRAFLGLKKSWLSREIVTFGVWPPLAMATIAILWFGIDDLLTPARTICCILGLLGVFTSVMVYADTKREFWRLGHTIARFFGTTLIGGSVFTIATLTFFKQDTPTQILGMLGIGLLLKTIIEISSLLPARDSKWSSAKKSALLQTGPLRKDLICRWSSLLLGLSLMIIAPIAGALAILTSEWYARKIFFRAVVAHKMPGQLPNPAHS